MKSFICFLYLTTAIFFALVGGGGALSRVLPCWPPSLVVLVFGVFDGPALVFDGIPWAHGLSFCW